MKRKALYVILLLLTSLLSPLSLIPVNADTEIVLLSDGFESSVWDENWNSISSDWYRNTYEHSGTQCAAARDGAEGAFTSNPVDASDAISIHVEFWFMKYKTDASDYTLSYWDGSSYVLVDDLTNNGGDYPDWALFSDDVSDSRFFVSDFRIRLVANLASGEDAWLDDVEITRTVSTSSPIEFSLLDDGFESSVWEDNWKGVSSDW